MAAAVLDEGEAAVIQLALDQGIRRVCIDERAGRRMASAVGLQVVGTLGLLLRAKQLGHLPALRPVVQRLTSAGAWYDQELLTRVFHAAGE
jgi:predicted nucleic acid-binding protein